MPIGWFKNYTGNVPKSQNETIILYSRINNYISKKSLKRIDYEEQIDELKYAYNTELKRISSNENKWYLYSSEEKRFENDKYIKN